MKKADLLRDIGIIVGIWGLLLTVLFETPDVAVPTKIDIAIVISITAVFGFPLYFMTNQVRQRRSFLLKVAIALIAIILLAYMGYVLDQIVFITWEWVQINGILVVTWVNLLDTFLFVFSLVVYYWAARTAWSSVPVWRQEWNQSARRRKSKKAAKADKVS